MKFSNIKTMAQNLGLTESYYGVCGGGIPTLNCRNFSCWNRGGNKDEDDDVYVEYIGENVVQLDIGGVDFLGEN